jgi:hypothetical protein
LKAAEAGAFTSRVLALQCQRVATPRPGILTLVLNIICGAIELDPGVGISTSGIGQSAQRSHFPGAEVVFARECFDQRPSNCRSGISNELRRHPRSNLYAIAKWPRVRPLGGKPVGTSSKPLCRNFVGPCFEINSPGRSLTIGKLRPEVWEGYPTILSDSIPDPQSNPQKRLSYTTSVVLGVPHGFVSR